MRKRSIPSQKLQKDEFIALRRVIERDLMKVLIAANVKPTITDAEELFLLAPVQEAAVFAAVELRKLAAEYENGGLVFSYRKFLVTAVGIGIVRNGTKAKWFVRVAYNTKPHKNQAKHCAEMRIMASMSKRRAILIGMLVLGLPREEDREITLHPCEVCRQLMSRQYRHLFLTSSRLILVNPNDPRREGYTVSDLIRHHGEQL